MGTEAESSLTEQVIEHCEQQRFTGVLRVRAQEGEGELWFLSGIADEARFGVSTGDEAMERLRRASEPKFELDPRLPNPKGGFKKGHPLEGPLGDVRPVDLFHFCEKHALTCTLEIESGDTVVHARYRVGELMELDPVGDAEQAVGDMLEWQQGSYRFELPPVELPADAARHTTQAARPLDTSLVEFLAVPELVESKRTSEAEIKRRAVEVAKRARADSERRSGAELEAKRKRKAEAEAEAKRKAEAEAESKRKAEAEAEAKRKAEAEAAAETEEPAEVEAEAPAAKEEVAARPRAVSERPAKKKKAKKKAAPAKASKPEPEPAPEPASSWTTVVWLLLVAAVVGYFIWSAR